VRSGTAADDDDLPEHRWVRVEFEETHEVIVDSEESLAALEGGYFDATGRAVASAVRAGEAVTFQSGDTALFVEEEATPLIDAGIATLVARYFVRPLNDFDYAFANFDRRSKQLDDAIYITERNYETVNDGLEKVENSIAYRNEEKGKLEDELAKFDVEREVIAQYHQQLEEHWAQTRREINELYRTNLLLERRLVDVPDVGGHVKELARDVGDLDRVLDLEPATLRRASGRHDDVRAAGETPDQSAPPDKRGVLEGHSAHERLLSRILRGDPI
jgi:hypothetical protein